MQMFLDGLSATIPAGVHMALVWDRAGYHTAGALRVPANMALVGLPPYSPELNPLERHWLYLRQHSWSNRVYEDIDAVEAAAMAGWRAVWLDPDKVRSTCRCEYLDACE